MRVDQYDSSIGASGNCKQTAVTRGAFLFSFYKWRCNFLGYVHTEPVPNGSDPKIVPDRPFVHTGPANRCGEFPSCPVV